MFETVPGLASRVRDGMTVAVGGTLFTRIPVRLLTAVCERAPRDLHYASWGGGLPLELLLQAGTVSRATICFSSLDIFGQAPRFQTAVTDGSLELIEWTALAFHQALWAGKRRLPSEPFVWPRGSDLVDLPGFPPAVPDPISGERVGAAPAMRPDVLLLHAPAADRDGNIVIVGARAMDLIMIPASRQVLVSVDAVVDRAELRRFDGGIVIPRHFITAISVVAGGAAPTSSLPFYVADFASLMAWTGSDDPLGYAREQAALDHPPVRRLPELDAATVMAAIDEEMGEPLDDGAPPTADEWMTVWLARQYPDDAVCSVGAVSPLASASYLLAKARSPGLTLITNGGCYVDVAFRPLLLGLGEWLDACSALTIMGGDDSYEWYYLPGLVTHEVVSVAQIDRAARTNNREVRTPTGKRLRMPGQGGMADVADMHRNFVIYLPRLSTLTTPERVEFTTASRSLVGDAERRRAGYAPGSVILVTNLAVFRLDAAEQRLMLSEVFPWTTLEALEDATGFDLGVTSLDGIPVAREPSDDELRTLRWRCDPLGIRRLEFVPRRDRASLLETVIAAEGRLAERVLGTPFHRPAPRVDRP